MLNGLDCTRITSVRANTRTCSTTRRRMRRHRRRADARRRPPKILRRRRHARGAHRHPAGDTILRIDGKSTDGMSLKDVVDRLRGAGGHARSHHDRAQEHAADRGQPDARVIHVGSVKPALNPNGIGYVRITNFAETTQHEVATAKMATSGGARPARRPGARPAQRSRRFARPGRRRLRPFPRWRHGVSIRGREPTTTRCSPAQPSGDRLNGVPIVVLINGASASASEIVAGALQDRRRASGRHAKLGKGSVQTIIPLDGHGALR